MPLKCTRSTNETQCQVPFLEVLGLLVAKKALVPGDLDAVIVADSFCHTMSRKRTLPDLDKSPD